jgi:hypothetical protein
VLELECNSVEVTSNRYSTPAAAVHVTEEAPLKASLKSQIETV